MSSNEYEDHGLLLGVIPPGDCEPWQLPRWDHQRPSLTYKLQRKPINLQELNQYGHPIAIWRDNGTLTYFTPCGSNNHPHHRLRCLTVAYFDKGPRLSITGITDEAVVETAAFFMSLESSTQHSSCVGIGTLHDEGYDFRAAQVQCLRHIFDVAPLRDVEFQNVILSAAQSLFLATRPQQIRLTLCDCTFEDGGTIFVNGLEDRTSLFGALAFETSITMHDDSLKRLLQCDMIGHLALPELNDEMALLPFVANVHRLDYQIRSSSLLEANLQSLHIVPSKLAIKIREGSDTFPTEPVLSFLRRLADLGHFVELKVRFTFDFDDDELQMEITDCVVDELIRTALANPKLQLLDLSTGEKDVKWDSHLETLFTGLKGHQGLRTLVLYVDKSAFGPDYSHLRQFLSSGNRNTTVIDDDGAIYSDDDGVIDELYSLNRFYRGSAGLVVKPLAERSSLVSTALMEIASDDFQRSALLLSNHTDALYELVQYSRLNELHAVESPPSSIQGNIQKRRRRVV